MTKQKENALGQNTGGARLECKGLVVVNRALA